MCVGVWGRDGSEGGGGRGGGGDSERRQTVHLGDIQMYV